MKYRASSEFAERLASYLLGIFESSGTFGQSLHLMPGWDARFSFRDWWIFFKSVPRMRVAMILGGILNSIWKPKFHSGFGYSIKPGNPLSFSHSSFFNDFLIWEILISARPFLSPSIRERIRNGIENSLSELEQGARQVERDEFKIPMYSYFSPVDSRTSSLNLFRTLFRLLDVAVPDNDSTSLVYSAALRVALSLDRQLTVNFKIDPFVFFLSEHVYREGRFAKGRLSYENGVSEFDRGVYTWILEENNEVDSCSNLNILGFLSVSIRLMSKESLEIAAKISRGIFDFLARHANAGDLMSPRFQQYYPLGAVLFYWDRFTEIWYDLESEAQMLLDPNRNFESLQAFFKNWATSNFLAAPTSFNDGDLIWASPFLEKLGMLERIDTGGRLNKILERKDRLSYEAFHVLYPVRLVCAAQGLLVASRLKALVIEMRNSSTDKAGFTPD